MFSLRSHSTSIPEVGEFIYIQGYHNTVFVVTDVAEFDNLCNVSQVFGDRTMVVPFWQIRETVLVAPKSTNSLK